MRFKGNEAINGEWIQPKLKGFKLSCCDCGLVHDINFIVIDKTGKKQKGIKIQFRAYRNNRSTSARRRWIKNKRWQH